MCRYTLLVVMSGDVCACDDDDDDIWVMFALVMMMMIYGICMGTLNKIGNMHCRGEVTMDA